MRERGVEFDAIEYLKLPPTREEIERLLDLLPNPPSELVRQDKNFAELGLKAADYETREAVVALLLDHPNLMQRPIVVAKGRAVIGRPPENVLELLD